MFSWFSWFNSGWLNTFSWFSVAGLIVAGVLAYFLGLRPLLEGFWTGVVWFVKNVLWEGIKDIFDAWPTIVTIAFAAFFLYTAMEVKQEAAVHKIDKSLEKCQAQVRDLKKYIPKLPKDFGKQKPFDWFNF